MIGDDFTSLPRGDLAAAVYRTIEDQVETIFGDSIATIDEHSDGVRLTFDHAEPRDFDLVIGADGLHSNVRRLVFGPEDNFEHYLGCKVAACVVDGYRPRDELVYVIYNTLGRQVARFALRDDRTMFLFVFRADHDEHRSGTKRSATQPIRRRRVGMPGHPGDPSPTSTTSTSTSSARSGWSAGRASRVLLIGDAAGCISLLGGEGTGLAMTEAYVLAGELAARRW